MNAFFIALSSSIDSGAICTPSTLLHDTKVKVKLHLHISRIKFYHSEYLDRRKAASAQYGADSRETQ